MSPVKRYCLVLESAQTTLIQRKLARLGWAAFSVPIEHTNTKTISSGYYTAGILHLQDSSVKVIDYLRIFLCRFPRLPWILLIPDNLLEDSSLCSFVARFCHFCVTYPQGKNGLFHQDIEDQIDSRLPMLEILLQQAHDLFCMRQREAEQRQMRGRNLIVGKSRVMQQLQRSISKVASVDAPVLIVGDSGTGKELVAHSIHQRSSRAGRPFVPINCGAIPVSLLQSELFGHEAGSFSGAIKRRIGRLEEANTGTVFLDEVGELPLEQQVNLLRFLQEKTVERVGGNQIIKLDVRIIAATHRNLEDGVKEHIFREDLYFRLAVLQINMPPLQQREDDIILLANHFFDQYISQWNTPLVGFSEGALRAMRAYDWPGNVRELMNRINHAVVMAEGPYIQAEDLGLTEKAVDKLPSNDHILNGQAIASLDEAKHHVEAMAVSRALFEAENNISKASRKLRISRTSMYRLMEKYNISASS